MSPEDRIANALSILIGEPMWAAGRAGNIVWLQFGPERATIGYKGDPRVVGTHALHLTCPWRWIEAWGDLRADDDFTHDGLAILGKSRPLCESVRVEAHGSFSLSFEDGSLLQAQPERDDEGEYWRLFEPGQETRHFVVGANGITE